MSWFGKLFGERTKAEEPQAAAPKAEEPQAAAKEPAAPTSSAKNVLEAAKSGDVAALRALVEAGADLNVKDDAQGWTPLMWATNQGHTEAAVFLIESGADVNAKPETCTTALMVAALQPDGEVVNRLLQAHVDVAAKDMRGKTALDLVTTMLQAVGGGDKELTAIRDALSQSGGSPPAQPPAAEASTARTEASSARTDAEEQKFQSLLIERELELMNVENVPGRGSSKLDSIESRLRELGWDGVERTRHP